MCLWSGAWGPRCCSDAWDPGWDRQGEQGGGQQCAADTEVDGHPKGLQVNLKNIIAYDRPFISRNTPNLYRWCVQSTINSILPWLSFPAFLGASLAPRWKWKGRLSRRNMKVVYIVSWLNLSGRHKRTLMVILIWHFRLHWEDLQHRIDKPETENIHKAAAKFLQWIKLFCIFQSHKSNVLYQIKQTECVRYDQSI